MKDKLHEHIPSLLKLIGCFGVTGILYWVDGNHVMLLLLSSKQLSEALTGILTFTSLILGFIGVLLPTIMGMKKESELIEKFFKQVSPTRFSMFVRSNILSGLLLTICTVMMFFATDMVGNGLTKAAKLLGWTTLFCSIHFVVTTFCVLNLLLRLLIENKKGEAYPNG